MLRHDALRNAHPVRPQLATTHRASEAQRSMTMYGGDFVPVGILIIFVTWAYLAFREET